MKLFKVLIVTLFSALWGTQAFSAEAPVSPYKVCISAIHTKNVPDEVMFIGDPGIVARQYLKAKRLVNGHASVVIMRGDETIRTYGYWPDNNLSINVLRDPLAVPEEYPNSEMEDVTGVRCTTVDRRRLRAIEAKAKAYPKTHGEFGKLMNNCVNFAVFLYQYASQEKLKGRLNTPHSLIKAIAKKNKREGASHRLKFRRMRKQAGRVSTPPTGSSGTATVFLGTVARVETLAKSKVGGKNLAQFD